MNRLVSQMDIVPALLLTGALFLYFDVVMALAAFAVTALGVFAVRRSMKGKERP